MKNKFSFRNIKLFFIKLSRAQTSVNEIALGMGIGAFISVFPTFGFGTLLVLLLHRFIQFNLIAALAASLISNPFTSPFFMLLSFKVGSAILGTDVHFSMDNWMENLGDTGLIMLMGSLVVSGLIAVIAYFVTKIVITKMRNRKPKI